LETTDGPRYVSMITNGSYAPNSVMGQILLASQRISRCPAWTAAVTLPAEPD
ncbi:MAG: D-alanyl-D-alanine carboxypeptidase, partial [Synechococcus sp.]